MKQEEQESVRVLRFFGSDDAGRAQVLRELTDNEKVSCQEMRKGSEVLLALQCEPDKNSAKLLDRCQEKIQQACGPAMYATNDVTLAQATVDVMKTQDKLFVAADAETSSLLEHRLEKIESAHSIFDFGQQSFQHPRFAEKIAKAGNGEKDPVFSAATRVQEAFHLSGADFAVACVPSPDSRYSTIVLGGKKGFWERTVLQDEVPGLWMLDMLRRAALDKAQASGTSWKTYDAMRDAAGEGRDHAGLKVFSYLPPKETVPASAAVVNHPENILMDAPNSTAAPAGSAGKAPSADVIKTEPEAPAAKETVPSAEEDKAPAPKKKRSAVFTLLITLLVLIAIAMIVIGIAWYLSGGDLASLWNGQFFSFSNMNGASLV